MNENKGKFGAKLNQNKRARVPISGVDTFPIKYGDIEYWTKN